MKKEYLDPVILLSEFPGKDAVCSSDNLGGWKSEWSSGLSNETDGDWQE